MEFKFNIQSIFSHPFVQITSNLLPVGFKGDRKMAIEVATKIADILNVMGEASAHAQGLAKPVTTAQKLRMSDHHIYLLGDREQGKNGAVVGYLKVGKKSLYVFDQNGETQMINTPCVLDFYVHESRQRAGYGKDLFDSMLKQEHFQPEKLAVDRPSDKLLGFLRKHYKLDKTIPQMNNFVVYQGFFDKGDDAQNDQMRITSSPNTTLFGPQFVTDEYHKRTKSQQNSSTIIPLIQNTPVGRYAAPRPMCSMAEIIHSTATPATGEPNRADSSQTDLPEFNFNIENLQINIESNIDNEHEHEHEHDVERIQEIDNIDGNNRHNRKLDVHFTDDEHHKEHEHDREITEEEPAHFHLSKQHTGLKNLSYNVGLAVSPTNKMDFDQEHQECLLKIHRPIDEAPAGLCSPHDTDDAAGDHVSSGVSAEGYTDHGYYDLKFHHNKLW